MLKSLLSRFRRPLKITRLSAVGEAGYVFIYGLGNDGKVYTWHVREAVWKLHLDTSPPPLTPEQQAAVDAAEVRDNG